MTDHVSSVTRSPIRHLLLGIAAAMVLTACAALPAAEAPQEYLDKETAATISVVSRPLVFARSRPEKAAHVRDYVTVAAGSVDRSGKTDYVIIAYFWSTLDAHDEPQHNRAESTSASDGHDEDLTMIADDRRIRLHLEGHSARDAGIGEAVHAPPGSSQMPNVYRTDLATLRFMAFARHLSVAGQTDSDGHYELWDDRRAALQGLVRSLSGE